MLAQPKAGVIDKILKPNDWNQYEIRCEGPRIRLYINGTQTIDFTETDPKIPLTGVIASKSQRSSLRSVVSKHYSYAVELRHSPDDD